MNVYKNPLPLKIWCQNHDLREALRVVVDGLHQPAVQLMCLSWAQARSESPWLPIVRCQNTCCVFQNICFLLSDEGPAGISAVVALRSRGRQGSFAKFQWLHHWRTKIMFIAGLITQTSCHSFDFRRSQNLGFCSPFGYETPGGESCG